MSSGGLVEAVLLWSAVGLVALTSLALYRAARGPTIQDRVVAVNALGTTAVVVIGLMAGALGRPGLLDVALIYAMLNFVLSIGVAKFALAREGFR